MAEYDRTRGYRDNETYRRPRPQTQSGEQSGDPLAELARLIGQQNQSAPSTRQSAGAAHYGSHSESDQGWSARDPLAQQDGSSQRSAGAHWPSSYADEPAQGSGAYGESQYDPRYDSTAPQAGRDYAAQPPSYGEPHPSGTGYAEGQYADPRYGDPQYAADPRYDDPRYAEVPYQDPRYADPRYAQPHYDGDAHGSPQGYADPRYADPHYPEPNFGGQTYGAPSYAPAQEGYPQSGGEQGYPAYGYQDGGQAYGNLPYGAPPLPGAMAPAAAERMPKRRGSIVTVLAVLALAVVGTAAAFGYRAMFSGAGTAVPPPVIKADTQPSKIVPATDPNSKPIQDRIGVKTEKVVPRQEEPVQQAAPGQPRVISPWLAGQNPQAFPPASANIAPGAAPQPASSEPKRIRTVPIKPQGAEAPGPRSSRSTGAAQPDEADTAHAQTGGAPLALAPTGSVPPQQRQAARQAHAAVTPNDAGAGGSPFPTPLPASAPSAPRASGPFAVQVTSQRSEADAQASFRSLQQQFPSVLGNRQPVIRRADLGDRGTYYRAQIPFSSQSEASEFCSSLKSAGGQCVVARN